MENGELRMWDGERFCCKCTMEFSGDKSAAFSDDKSVAFSGDPKGSVERGAWNVERGT